MFGGVEEAWLREERESVVSVVCVVNVVNVACGKEVRQTLTTC